MRRDVTALVVLALVTAGTLSGCGSDTGPASSSAQVATTAPTPTPQPVSSVTFSGGLSGELTELFVACDLPSKLGPAASVSGTLDTTTYAVAFAPSPTGRGVWVAVTRDGRRPGPPHATLRWDANPAPGATLDAKKLATVDADLAPDSGNSGPLHVKAMVYCSS